MSIQYAAVRRAFEYLEKLVPLDDQVELDSQRLDLMEEPTRAKAASMYVSGINLWFSEHRANFDDNKRVAAIRERYYY